MHTTGQYSNWDSYIYFKRSLVLPNNKYLATLDGDVTFPWPCNAISGYNYQALSSVNTHS